MLKHLLVMRKKDGEKYGGGPCDLAMTDLSTHRQVIQYYHYLTHINPNTDFPLIVQQITSALKNTWSIVNPRLPILSNERLYKKIQNLLSLVEYINLNNDKSPIKCNLDAKLDKLFDISTCFCSLDILPCSDKRVNCMIEKCLQEHIICICPKNAKIPIEDRVYLRNQRSKTEPKLSLISEILTESPEHPSSFSNNEGENIWKPRKKPSRDLNILKLPRFTAELVRNKCPSNLGITLANALLHDIKHLLRPEVDIKHLLRPEVDINHIMLDMYKLDWAKTQVKTFCEDVELCENTQSIYVGEDGRADQKILKYQDKQLLNEESVTNILPHMDINTSECDSYLLDNVKTEVEVKEEVVDDYFEASSEDFVQDTQEEYVSLLENSSYSSSSCDADSSPSTTQNSWIEFPVLSKSRKLPGNSTGFPLFSPENNIPRRVRRCRRMNLSPETKYRRIRDLNNEASTRYRIKKKMEREHLDEMLRNEQERNVQLKNEFKRLTKEYSNTEKILKFYLSPKKIEILYSSD